MEAFKAQMAFLLDCNETLILEHGHSSRVEDKAADLQDVVLVKLDGLLLKSLEPLRHCTMLRICVLADNFLTSFDPLAECVHLTKLDLKGNQIEQLPNAQFWRNLKELQVLHLHSNSMIERKNITGLSDCPNLLALTMYDTPLSLKANYRHCVINTVWSLKALDNYIISDEEMIENWKLPDKFKAKAPHLQIRLYSSAKDSYESEMKVIQGIIAEINGTLAVYSPTLIIQKWIRGHLTRRRLGMTHQDYRRQVTWTSTLVSSSSKRTSRASQIEYNTDEFNLIREKPDLTLKSRHANLPKLVQDDCSEMLQDAMSVTSLDGKKTEDVSVPCNTPLHGENLITDRMKLDMTTIHGVHNGMMNSETFHVFGFKASMHLSEPLPDMLISRKAAGRDIRDAICHFHSLKPKPPYWSQSQRSNTNTTAERCNDKPLALALNPVRETVNWTRRRAKLLQERAEKVAIFRAYRDDAQRCRDDLRETRRKDVLLQQDWYLYEMEKTLSLQKDKREQEVRMARRKHSSFLEEKRRRLLEQEMVARFSRQHGYVTNIIARLGKMGFGKQQARPPQLPENKKENIQAEALMSQLWEPALPFRGQDSFSNTFPAQYRILKPRSRVKGRQPDLLDQTSTLTLQINSAGPP